MVNEGFEDYQKSFELLGDYIAHIHIKNGILAPDGEDELGACKWKRVWTPLKKGMADLKKLFAVARKAGYDARSRSRISPTTRPRPTSCGKTSPT